MSWQIIVALVVALPIILLPVLLVWYLNSSLRTHGSISKHEAEGQTNVQRVAAMK